MTPAAFGRLCVETWFGWKSRQYRVPAAFGRLCVETIKLSLALYAMMFQPPSGGCVLKQAGNPIIFHLKIPAAFGRLCVETICCHRNFRFRSPAAFGRLCVETSV